MTSFKELLKEALFILVLVNIVWFLIPRPIRYALRKTLLITKVTAVKTYKISKGAATYLYNNNLKPSAKKAISNNLKDIKSSNVIYKNANLEKEEYPSFDQVLEEGYEDFIEYADSKINNTDTSSRKKFVPGAKAKTVKNKKTTSSTTSKKKSSAKVININSKKKTS